MLSWSWCNVGLNPLTPSSVTDIIVTYVVVIKFVYSLSLTNGAAFALTSKHLTHGAALSTSTEWRMVTLLITLSFQVK